MFSEKRWRLIALFPIEQAPMDNSQGGDKVTSDLA